MIADLTGTAIAYYSVLNGDKPFYSLVAGIVGMGIAYALFKNLEEIRKNVDSKIEELGEL